jgi:hypothetical protein
VGCSSTNRFGAGSSLLHGLNLLLQGLQGAGLDRNLFGLQLQLLLLLPDGFLKLLEYLWINNDRLGLGQGRQQQCQDDQQGCCW